MQLGQLDRLSGPFAQPSAGQRATLRGISNWSTSQPTPRRGTSPPRPRLALCCSSKWVPGARSYLTWTRRVGQGADEEAASQLRTADERRISRDHWWSTRPTLCRTGMAFRRAAVRKTRSLSGAAGAIRD